MSRATIRRYSDTTREFEQAFAEINGIASLVGEVYKHLIDKPHVFMISNINVGFPMELSLKRDVFTLDANKWPSAKDIAEAIVTLQDKRKRLKYEYNALSETDKKLVSAPDTRE